MTPEQYRAIRLRLGLSQAQLAERLEIARETISRRESGVYAIGREAQLAITHKAVRGDKG